jgi:SNF2 family DNA or RNA helicase
MTYNFKTQPWKHQLDVFEGVRNSEAGLLNMGMGTGKSHVVVNVVNYRQHLRTLIVCPLSVMGVWPREFARHCAGEVRILKLDQDGSKAKLAAARAADARANGPLVLIINYDSAWREPLGKWLLCQRWDLVVADESHRAKKPTGRTSKWLGQMRNCAAQRLCLSGTPMPHSPLDIWAQYRFLDPTIFGKSFTEFRAKYAVTDRMFPSKVLRWINQEELSARVNQIAFHVGAEVLDLPPLTHQVIDCELCPAARRAYEELSEQMATELDQGLLTASNALVKLLRLQQLTGGAAQVDDGPLVEIDHAKEAALLDLLEDLPKSEPVVVFCRFRHDLAVVERVAEKTGRMYGELSGERRDLTDHAEMPAGIELMAVQTQSGGVGIDLTRACYVVYYSLGFSLGEYEQSLARAHRPGQTRPTHVYHLVAKRTIDGIVYKALAKRKQVVEAVLHGFQEHRVCADNLEAL